MNLIKTNLLRFIGAVADFHLRKFAKAVCFGKMWVDMISLNTTRGVTCSSSKIKKLMTKQNKKQNKKQIKKKKEQKRMPYTHLRHTRLEGITFTVPI